MNEEIKSFRLCVCGCPYVLHKEGTLCLHCLAYGDLSCVFFRSQEEHDEVFVINKHVLREITILLMSSGLCAGIGLMGLLFGLQYFFSTMLLVSSVVFFGIVLRFFDF